MHQLYREFQDSLNTLYGKTLSPAKKKKNSIIIAVDNGFGVYVYYWAGVVAWIADYCLAGMRP